MGDTITFVGGREAPRARAELERSQIWQIITRKWQVICV